MSPHPCSRPRWRCLLAAVVALVPVVANAEPVDNPALLYWQAFSVMPTLSDAERQIQDHRRTVPVDDAYAAVAHRYDPAFRLVRKAATLKGSANWGIDLSDGPEALLPHLAKAKSVALATQFRMRYFIAQGQAGEAVQDAVATLAMSRHLGSDAVLISALVQIAIDAIVINAVAEHYHGFDGAAAGLLLAGLQSLPKPVTISDCIHKGERSFGRWFRTRIEAIRVASGGDETKALVDIRELFARTIREEKDYEMADQFIRDAGGTLESLFQAVRELDGYYDELTAITQLPYETYAAAQDAFFEKALAGKNPLVRELLPALRKSREKEFRAEARMGLLRAALLYRLRGEEGWRSVPDPFGSGPFEFTRFHFQGQDRGFQLSSAFKGDPREVLILVEQDGPPFRVSGTQPGRAVEAP